ncbi:MAG: hypothetical protein LWW75_08125, partial [Chlorobiales bacterium]|nr:hypothetical protein [Chlorobiales bacterium]
MITSSRSLAGIPASLNILYSGLPPIFLHFTGRGIPAVLLGFLGKLLAYANNLPKKSHKSSPVPITPGFLLLRRLKDAKVFQAQSVILNEVKDPEYLGPLY